MLGLAHRLLTQVDPTKGRPVEERPTSQRRKHSMTETNARQTVILTAPKAVADNGRVSTGGLQRAIIRTAL